MIDTTVIKQAAPDLLSLIAPMTDLRKVSGSHGGEWSGACPFCGGKDRFSAQPYNAEEPRWLCRHCTDGKWQDVIEFVQRRDNSTFTEACNDLFGGNIKIAIDPKEYEQLKQRQAENIQRQAEETKVVQAAARESLHESQVWLAYHENLEKFGTRELWHERGISDEFIDIYRLGYCPSFPFGDTRYPSLTIPTWRADRVVGLDHRALADIKGKYRPERAGLGKALFFGDPSVLALSGKVLLLEGQIKTAVTFAHVWGAMPASGHPLYLWEIVGISGTSFKGDWIAEFKECDEIAICLDPDASDKAEKIAEALGRERCRLVELPAKIDDLIIMGALDMDGLANYLRTARKA